ncbi:MAG: SDR family oxidoreductase [Kaiparowitsia implicata GSE-PSE-MK54-09C]|jgi:uncharacterized protein YbjT (DUF2867 family)|nr:SDR family oxidoreductase [Kaiparowitsia implicata GSE-PSE-MK54-09C]
MHRIAVIGATGLLGSHIVAALAANGKDVIAMARHVAEGPIRLPVVRWARMDLAHASQPDWHAVLEGVDAVVNCAGALQEGPVDDLVGTHETGLRALVAACETAGVRRFVHFSAMGVDQATPTEFSRSKWAGDQALVASKLDWVILRPSVVLGASAYGASALIRGLAALPLLPVMADTAPLRPVALDDVVTTVRFFLDAGAPTKIALNLAGPERFDFTQLVKLYRQWLGFRPAPEVNLPAWLGGLLYQFGDLAGRLGWRPPVRTTARLEIARGAAADNSEWVGLTGVDPQRISMMLNAGPASVQERWFAGLYLVKPVALVSLIVFWIGSGLASIGPGHATGIAMMQQGGAGAWAPFAVIGGGVADLLIGFGIALRPAARAALLAGMTISLLYAVAGTIVTPWLWLDPLAALLKIAPILALHIVALVTLRDR